jgi:hypothetical protein
VAVCSGTEVVGGGVLGDRGCGWWCAWGQRLWVAVCSGTEVVGGGVLTVCIHTRRRGFRTELQKVVWLAGMFYSSEGTGSGMAFVLRSDMYLHWSPDS